MFGPEGRPLPKRKRETVETKGATKKREQADSSKKPKLDTAPTANGTTKRLKSANGKTQQIL